MIGFMIGALSSALGFVLAWIAINLIMEAYHRIADAIDAKRLAAEEEFRVSPKLPSYFVDGVEYFVPPDGIVSVEMIRNRAKISYLPNSPIYKETSAGVRIYCSDADFKVTPGLGSVPLKFWSNPVSPTSPTLTTEQA